MIYAELWGGGNGKTFISLMENRGDEGSFLIGSIKCDDINMIRRDTYVYLYSCTGSCPEFEVAEVRDCRGRSGPDELREAPWIFPLDGEVSE